jgi:hypothetical protein
MALPRSLAMPDTAEPARAERDRLPFANRFLLWAIRIWVVAYHQQRSPMAVLDRAFGFLGLQRGAELINRTMMALGAAGRRQIDIHPPCYTGLSDDERRILRMVGLAQHGEGTDFRFILLSLVEPGRRQPLESLIRELGRELLSARLDLAWAGAEDPAPPDRPAAQPAAAGPCALRDDRCRKPH